MERAVSKVARYRCGPPGEPRLLADQAQVAGNAEPLAVLLDPGVREPAQMRELSPFLGALLVIRAGDDHSVAVAVQPHVLPNVNPGLAGFVPDGRQGSGIGHKHYLAVREPEIPLH